MFYQGGGPIHSPPGRVGYILPQQVTERRIMTKRASATAESGRPRLHSFLLVLGIVLLAANLRPALTGVAPLIGQIREDTGISNGVAGLLTTLPLLAFGLLSPIAPRVARLFGMERVLLASLLVLAAGILLRWAGAVAALFLGTYGRPGSGDRGSQRAPAEPRQARVPRTHRPHDERVLHFPRHQRRVRRRRERPLDTGGQHRLAR